MRALLAPDKFKGTFSANELVDAMVSALPPGVADRCPVADGGDGTASILLDALGGTWVEAPCHDALGRPLSGRYAVLDDGTAVVEVSEASGMARLDPEELDAVNATSLGTGELIAHAIAGGAGRILVACGGSATTDAGLGALAAFDPRKAGIICLCDINSTFSGALRYAPQKGATGAELELLARRLDEAAQQLPRDPRQIACTGSAGGLAGGFWAHGARLVGGAAYLLDAVGFDQRLEGADVVLTGEGEIDHTSIEGKAVSEVALRCRRAGVPVHAIVGSNAASAGDIERLGLASVLEAPTLEAVAARTREIFDRNSTSGLE